MVQQLSLKNMLTYQAKMLSYLMVNSVRLITRQKQQLLIILKQTRSQQLIQYLDGYQSTMLMILSQ